MSSSGPPRPPGMPAYPQPPGGARLPPMPPGIKAHKTMSHVGGSGAPPMPPSGAGGGARFPHPPSGGQPMPPMPPGGGARYPQPPTGAAMPPGLPSRPAAPPRGHGGGEAMDATAFDPTQSSGGGGGPVSNAYLAPPTGSAYPVPPPQQNMSAYPPPPSDYQRGRDYEEQRYGDEGRYNGDYGGRDDGRRSRGARYDDDGSGRHHHHGGGRRDDRQRVGGRSGRQGGQRSLMAQPSLREPTNTVWIGNVDPSLHPDQRLVQTFKEFGMVMRLGKYPEKGFGFIHFRTVEEARNAVETLIQRGTLSPAVLNYSKMCEYSPEDMALPFDPNHEPIMDDSAPRHGGSEAGPMMGGGDSYNAGPGMRRGRDAEEDRHGGGEGEMPERRRARGEPLPPTCVLWVGSLPPFVSSQTLTDLFSPFGNITRVTRMEKSNIAFVHFETVEQCTLALNTMTGRTIEGGAVLALNYGHQPRAAEKTGEDGAGGGANGGIGAQLELDADGFPVNESRTNAIYMGQIPADATEEEVSAVFAPFEGFINARYVDSNAIAFGHYDTVEHALAARVGMHNAMIRGTPLRVMFAKSNHSMTLADRPGADGSHGALTLSGGHGGAAGTSSALTALPARGGGGDGSGLGAGGASSAPVSAYTRTRPAPVDTMESRLQTLLSVPYNQCGASGAEVSPSQIDVLCRVVDLCVDETSAVEVDQAISLYLPAKATHVFNVVAKRMLAYFKEDPHKRLLILYATTRAMLGAETKESEMSVYNEASLNAYLMVIMAALENQTTSGLDRLSSILENLGAHSFLKTKSHVSQGYAEEFGTHLEEMMERVKAEQDLASLLSGGKSA